MKDVNKIAIAMIGFGEVGSIFSKGFLAAGAFTLAAYDIMIADRSARDKLAARASAAGVRLCASAAEAAAGADIVISAVTATSALAAAEEATAYLRPGQFFLDVNSVSPQTKRRDCKAVESAGAAYVEAAVMAPVAPYGLKVPIVLGGARAAELKQLLKPAAMRLELGEVEIGKASALKMCRSVIVKGLEALTLECFLAARIHGVEDQTIASLRETFPGVDWDRLAGYNLERVLAHGRRRAAEMREAAETLAETGMTPFMASATAERIDWAADQVQRRPGLKLTADEGWREAFDELADACGYAGSVESS